METLEHLEVSDGIFDSLFVCAQKSMFAEFGMMWKKKPRFARYLVDSVDVVQHNKVTPEPLLERVEEKSGRDKLATFHSDLTFVWPLLTSRFQAAIIS